MGTGLPRVFCVAVVSLLAAPACFAQQATPQPLITQPIAESQLVTLKGNTHPLAQAKFDIGIAQRFYLLREARRCFFRVESGCRSGRERSR